MDSFDFSFSLSLLPFLLSFLPLFVFFCLSLSWASLSTRSPDWFCVTLPPLLQGPAPSVDELQARLGQLLQNYCFGLWKSKLPQLYQQMFAQQLPLLALEKLDTWTHVCTVSERVIIVSSSSFSLYEGTTLASLIYDKGKQLNLSPKSLFFPFLSFLPLHHIIPFCCFLLFTQFILYLPLFCPS